MKTTITSLVIVASSILAYAGAELPEQREYSWRERTKPKSTLELRIDRLQHKQREAELLGSPDVSGKKQTALTAENLFAEKMAERHGTTVATR
jgi:hypothetical protein